MDDVQAPGPEELLALVAERGDRAPGEVPEELDSLDLAWLLAAVEERYGLALEPSDAQLARMGTITGAAAVIAGMAQARRRA